ncbi:MAG: DUF3530 family protein [Proteobacteria bacterium]|nr:DUF3530 family protein [Pseudomonadota bacterium]
MNALYRCLVIALALTFAPAALAQPLSDLAREKRWADQVLPSLVVGDAVWLESGGVKFLSLYAAPEKSRGAVLLLHSAGLHPNHGITGELRVVLVDKGWATLSVQLPVHPADVDDGAEYRKLYPEAGARIEAALALLRAKGFARPAVVSHAIGSGMFHGWWRTRRDPAIAAWAAMSFYGVFEGVAGAPFPVFDLYGENDYRGVRGPAEDRKEILDKLPGSRQLAAADGGRFLAGGEQTVLREVAAFLGTVTP